ncbi:MAG: class I SAM-dependent methyltransferase [Candidatus Hodarchaeales archaeon]|jgi:ubiquinone/menaquinone biosynthesis C-methylase UbiE
MDRKKITESNREAWNEVTPLHQKARKVNLEEKFTEKGFSVLDPIETKKLQKIKVKGMRIAHLCCNNGRELLSILNALEAESGVGFDISDEAIKEANNLQQITGLNCKFKRTDIYEIDEEYFNSFDMVYITVGALVWLPDMDELFQIASKLLKPKGQLFMYEMHPFLDMLDPENKKDPLKITDSYFKVEPWIETAGIDYIGKTKYKAKTTIEFTHKLSDIINAIIKSGIQIIEFNEYSHDISAVFEHLEQEHMVPLCYLILGKKE